MTVIQWHHEIALVVIIWGSKTHRPLLVIHWWLVWEECAPLLSTLKSAHLANTLLQFTTLPNLPSSHCPWGLVGPGMGGKSDLEWLVSQHLNMLSITAMDSLPYKIWQQWAYLSDVCNPATRWLWGCFGIGELRLGLTYFVFPPQQNK